MIKVKYGIWCLISVNKKTLNF